MLWGLCWEGRDMAEQSLQPREAERWEGPDSSLPAPNSPTCRSLLPPAYLGQQLGVGRCFGPHILGLGDVKEDIHNIGGDVQ